MKALNSQFASWVRDRAQNSPLVSWQKGCEDYLAHARAIKVRSRRSLNRMSTDVGGMF